MYYLTRQFCFCTERYTQTNITFWLILAMILFTGNILGTAQAQETVVGGFFWSALGILNLNTCLTFLHVYVERNREYAKLTQSWNKVVIK